jgi:hypothetical protein
MVNRCNRGVAGSALSAYRMGSGGASVSLPIRVPILRQADAWVEAPIGAEPTHHCGHRSRSAQAHPICAAADQVR